MTHKPPVITNATKDVYIRGMAEIFRQTYPTGSVPVSAVLYPNQIKAFPGIDKDGNGELNFAEFMELAGQSFDRYDQHPRDGILTKEEIERGHRESNEPKEESLWSLDSTDSTDSTMGGSSRFFCWGSLFFHEEVKSEEGQAGNIGRMRTNRFGCVEQMDPRYSCCLNLQNSMTITGLPGHRLAYVINLTSPRVCSLHRPGFSSTIENRQP
jgi:hypothetical protein